MSANRPFDDPPQVHRDDQSLIGADERHEFAREVHDATAHLLAALQRQLGELTDLCDPEAEILIWQCQNAIDEIRNEIDALDRFNRHQSRDLLSDS